MEYEKYRKKVSKEEFFSKWVPTEYEALTDSLKKEIYHKFLMRVEVLNRDSFTCQHLNCDRCKNVQYHPKLTVHHIKAQRNGGKHTTRNGVTLCESIHQAFNRNKSELIFPNKENIPPHIRGHTFKSDTKLKKINPKQKKAEMKKFRKTLMDKFGVSLTMDQVVLLMKFLEINFSKQN